MTIRPKRPFSRGYAIRVTFKHMLADIDNSIQRTCERIDEYAGNLEKSREIFVTLGELHALKKLVQRIQRDDVSKIKE